MKRKHDDDFLRAALRGYEAQLQDISNKIEGIRQQLRGKVPEASGGAKHTHRMSPEGRARISAAQKLRWKNARKASAVA